VLKAATASGNHLQLLGFSSSIICLLARVQKLQK
jgi:hypothetical protein